MSQPFQPPTKTDRGFMHFDPFRDLRGEHEVKVYESSNAEHACVWLKVEQQPTLASPGGVEVAAHLDLDACRLLRDQLNYFVEHHYHLEGGA